MAKNPGNSAPLSDDDRNIVRLDDSYIAPSFEDKLQLFWERNSRFIITLFVLAAAAISVRGVLSYMAERQQKALQDAYQACTDSAQLQSFADAHAGTKLAGVALLRLADESYGKGEYDKAVDLYNKSLTDLKDTPMASRAQLGAAIADVYAGKADAAKATLSNLADDTSLAQEIRAEASYNLAAIARDAGDIKEATKRADQVISIASSGLWGQRAMMLKARLPEEKKADDATATPAATDPAPATSDSAIKFNAAKS